LLQWCSDARMRLAGKCPVIRALPASTKGPTGFDRETKTHLRARALALFKRATLVANDNATFVPALAAA